MAAPDSDPTAQLSVVSAAKERAARFVVDRAEESFAGGETRSLLRRRLKLATLCLLTIVGVFAIRNPFVEGASGRGDVSIGVLASLLVALVFLFRNQAPSLRALRGVELVVFGVIALQVAVDNYLYILEMARARNGIEVLSEMLGTTLSFFALITFYGMFIPNTLRRAIAIIGGYGLVFVMLVPVMRLHDPEAVRYIGTVVNWEQRSSMAIMVLFGVLISVTGSAIIGNLRAEVIEAQQMGQYRLTEMIGKGGMGEVWKAEHALLARPAAVKLIRPEVLDPENPAKAEAMIRRFEREAQTTAALRSVHSVELYDFGIADNGDLYFVMEMLDGVDLESLVSDAGPLPPARVRYLIDQVCDSLGEAHERGLVHRDVKPANILTCRMGGEHDFVKVLDFGLAKAQAPEMDAESARLTTEGMVIGTPAYMAPEAATRGKTDGRSDIYALGGVMYWLLTGQLVFEGSDPMSMVVRHVKEVPEPPSKRSEQPIPHALDRIVMRCLEKDPGGRPQTAGELKQMLAEAEVSGSWTSWDALRWWTTHPSVS